jgi:hypothetical protein
LRIKKLIERDILKKGLLRSPNLLSYYGRDKTHDEFIDDWVEYIKKTPTSVWKLELNKFIDAQYEKSREFYARFAKSKFKRIKKAKAENFKDRLAFLDRYSDWLDRSKPKQLQNHKRVLLILIL